MLIATDQSVVLASYKCGTKALHRIDSLQPDYERTSPNDLFGYNLIDYWEGIGRESLYESLTPSSLKYFKLFDEGTHNVPFYILIRNIKQLFRAQIVQALRDFCRQNPILDENIVLTTSDSNSKNLLFEMLLKYQPGIYSAILSDQHYIKQSLSEVLLLVQYLQIRKPEIFERIVILNIDEYDTTEESEKYLKEIKVLDPTLYSTINTGHSTKYSLLPEIFNLDKLPKVYKVTYNANKVAIDLLYRLYYDKFYTFPPKVK